MMHINDEHKKVILVAFLGIFLTLMCVSWYIQEKQEAYTSFTERKIAEQENKLSIISDLLHKDSADEVVNKIIKDCSLENRAEFDLQLSKLPELRGSQLIEMEKLFNACGNFYAVQKAVMVSKLNREYEIYNDLVSIVAIADPKAKLISYNTENWKTRVELESKKSELFTQLVDLQGRIIRGLRQQMTISSDEMQAMLVEGQKVKEEIATLSMQIDSARQTIPGL